MGLRSERGPPDPSEPFTIAWRSFGHPWSLTLLILMVGICYGLPSLTQPKNNMSNSAVSLAVEFMTKFGYLPSSDQETGNLMTENQLRQAIRAMQRFAHIPATGVIDEATLVLMRRKRCGVPDMVAGGARRVRRYALQGQKWHTNNLTWSVKEPVGQADPSMVRAQLGRAFAVWSDASALTFTERHGGADIVVSFPLGPHGDGYPFDGEGAVLAHAFFPGEGIGGDAHFDADERWLSQQPEHEEEGVNLFAVAAHEIGHSLGLSHSSTQGSLMFPYYQIVDDNFKLPEDDTNGIQQLYGPKHPVKWATMPTAYPTFPTLPPTTTQENAGGDIVPSVETTSSTEGGFATVLPTTPKESGQERTEAPDMCNTSIDAISVIRREVFLFKGKYFWRLDRNRTLRKGYPVPIDRFWYNLPHDIHAVDALYERPSDTKIVFFSGKQYWLFAANQPMKGYPRPITDLGLPSTVERIDAAIVWGHNGKTYFFSGNKYWKFDEAEGVVELDYPRDIRAWRGIPHNIDAAFQWTDGNTYFFKGTKYWKFNDIKMKTHDALPGEISEFWFRCESTNERLPSTTTTEAATILESSINNTSSTVMCFPFTLIIAFHILCYFISKHSH